MEPHDEHPEFVSDVLSGRMKRSLVLKSCSPTVIIPSTNSAASPSTVAALGLADGSLTPTGFFGATPTGFTPSTKRVAAAHSHQLFQGPPGADGAEGNDSLVVLASMVQEKHPVKAEKPWLRRTLSSSSSDDEAPSCREHKLWSNDDYFKMEKAKQAKQALQANQEALETPSQSPVTPAASESLDRARALSEIADTEASPRTPAAPCAAGSPSPAEGFQFCTPPATLPGTSPLALGKRAASRELNADAWIAGPWVVGKSSEQELKGGKEGERKGDCAGDSPVLHYHATRAAKKVVQQELQQSAEDALRKETVYSLQSRTGFCYDDRMLDHESTNPDHPEQPGRLLAVYEMAKLGGLLNRCARIQPRLAKDAELEAVHSRAHVASVDLGFQRHPGPEASSFGDIYYSKGTATAARLAAGCTVAAAEAVCSGRVSNAFCLIRPPGHHATNTEAMGFCFYNNVAVAAKEVLRTGAATRVLVLDWDVHHGNGTQDILEDDERVLFVSLHRYGEDFYPGTGGVEEVGVDGAEGHCVNVPWTQKGCSNHDYLTCLDQLILPIARSFAPDLVIISAGFDAALGDPLGGMKMTALGYAHMTQRLLTLAGGKMLVALEGGYNEQMTAQCADAVIRTLLGDAVKDLAGPRRLKGSTEAIMRKVHEVQSKYWPCLLDDDFLHAFNNCFRAACLTPNAQVRKEAQNVMGSIDGKSRRNRRNRNISRDREYPGEPKPAKGKPEPMQTLKSQGTQAIEHCQYDNQSMGSQSPSLRADSEGGSLSQVDSPSSMSIHNEVDAKEDACVDSKTTDGGNAYTSNSQSMIPEIELEGLSDAEKVRPASQSLFNGGKPVDSAQPTHNVCGNADLDSNGAESMGPTSPGAALSTLSLCSQDSEQSSLVHVTSSDTSDAHMDAVVDLFCDEGGAVESSCRKMRLWNRVDDD